MKYALITGGSRGIGRAISIKLASMGYPVIINYVSNAGMAEETAEIIRSNGGQAELMQFDVRDNAAVTKAVNGWQEEHPDDYIAVLVNNAGIREDNLMVWMEADSWKRVLDITLEGFFNVTKTVLQAMIVNKFGRIINIASLSGLKGLPGQVNYSAAKGGLIAATKALAQEVGKKKVTVNAIAPGFIRTDMTEALDESELKKNIPAGRFGTPEEVASLAGFLASDESSYITGECISVNGGLYT